MLTASLLLIVGCESKTPAPAAEPAAEAAKEAPAGKTEMAAAADNKAADPEAEAAAGAGQCPNELKSYSEFVDQYIGYMEKISGGDMSAMAQAQPLMQKAQKAAMDLQSAKLEGDCLKRFVAIQGRMSMAAAKMAGTGKAAVKEIEVANEDLGEAADQVACMQGCNGIADPMTKMKCLQGCQ